ncbi:MAG: hypothetical protein N2258_04475 [Brevinematales bacterium]|nr:hypothetical protein [Brevinematales bacterium]
MKIFGYLLCFVFSFNLLFCEADASIVIREHTLNKFLAAIGDIEKSEPFNVSGIKGEFHWLVQNPKLVLTPNRAKFQADVTVSLKTPKLSYSTPAYGEVSVIYDSVSNRINVKVEKVAFEVAFTIFGKRIKITEVDISRFYRIAFAFPGPKPFESSVDVTMPDDSKKKIKIEAKPVLAIEEGKIVVGSEMVYTPIK